MKAEYKKYIITASLLCLGCIVLFALLYMVLLIPQHKEKKEAEKTLARKEQAYNSALKATSKDVQKQMKEELGELQNRLGNFVIKSEVLADLIFDISRMARNRSVSSFDIESENDRGGDSISNCSHIAESTIDLSFTAEFEEFATLLNALERHQPFIFIDEFSISGSRREGEKPRINMDLAVFVEKEEES